MTKPFDSDAIFQALADEYARVGEGGIGRFQARLILLLVARIEDDAMVHDAIRIAAEQSTKSR